jgi:hypothetical protein
VLVLLQRDPLAVLLSMWNRWSYVPRAHEREVIESARNQAWLARQSGLECVTVRYEHLVEDTTHLASLLGTVDATGLESLRDGRPVTSPDWSPGWTPSPELAAAREGLGYGAIPTPVAPAAARATWLARSSTRAAIAGARRRVGRLRTAGRDA